MLTKYRWKTYVLAVFYLFSHHSFFDVPGPIFAKLPHDAVCPEIFYLLYGCTYVPPKNFRGGKPPIFADLQTQNRH